MTRAIAETILVCALVLASYQWARYADLATEQAVFVNATGAEVDTLTIQAKQISSGMNNCWRRLSHTTWQRRWGRNGG